MAPRWYQGGEMAVRRIDFSLTKGSGVTLSDVMECVDRADLREAIAAFNAKQGEYLVLTTELTREFVEWGTKVKNACRAFKWGKIGFLINLVQLSVGAVASGYSIYSAMKDLPKIEEDEPEFSFCLCHDYKLTESKHLFVNCSRYSLVGSSLHYSGRARWTIHFRF
jgi:hypothetical protein